MIEMQMISQQFESLQEHAENSDKQLLQITEVIKALDELENCKAGQEILVPVTSGIFARGSLKKGTLLVNVGDGTVVEKSAAQTKKLLEEQRDDISEYRAQIMMQIQELVQRIGEMEDVQKSEG